MSVITMLNLPKDVINDLGSQRFAAETGQELISFYSEDTVNSSNYHQVATQRTYPENYRSVEDYL